MTKIEDKLDEIFEERPQDVYEGTVQRADGEYMPDEEDLEDVLDDCLLFVQHMRARNLPKSLEKDAADLESRLIEAVQLYVLH